MPETALSTEKKTIKGVECKWVINVPKRGHDTDDVHFIKETVHYSDGTTGPAIRLLRNYQRPFWITAKEHRNHIQKKEYEHRDKLVQYKATESDLRREVARALGKPWSRDTLRDLQASPYLYGTDIESTVFIKHAYKTKSPTLVSKCTVAGFDVETKVLDENDAKTVIIASMVFEGEAILAVTKEFLNTHIATAEHFFKMLMQRHLKEDIDPDKVTFKIVENDLEAIIACFDWAHIRKPDIVAIWNMDFDISRIMETFKKYGEDPAQLLSDPSVPKEDRYCYYKRGPTNKVTASGVFKPKPPEEQWHTLFLTASFYVIDPMGTQRQLRITAPKEPGYSLDAMLERYLNRRKLTMGIGEGLTKKKWHILMQQEHKIEYCVYNIWDSLSMLKLDDKLQDMFTLYSSANYSPFHRFSSQPKKIADKYAFFLMGAKRGYILGTIPPEVIEDETAADLKADKIALERQKNGYEEPEPGDDDEETGFESQNGNLGLAGWVLTLDPQNITLGLRIFEDDRTLHSNIRKFCFDSDATAAYPTITDVCNVSKTTTRKEIIAIEGIDKDVFRMQNLNFILGAPNAIEYCTTMHALPKPYEMLELVMAELQ